jgi:hypothetical protein
MIVLQNSFLGGLQIFSAALVRYNQDQSGHSDLIWPRQLFTHCGNPRCNLLWRTNALKGAGCFLLGMGEQHSHVASGSLDNQWFIQEHVLA